MTLRRGWCPGVFDPMPSGDGLLVRVKPPRMGLSAEAAIALAEAAARHGNGTIELTSRGNVQVRGLSAASAAPFAQAMIGCGLASADADAERRRVVMVSPLLGDDPSLAPGTGVVVAAIEQGLRADRGFAALPAKFGIVVDGGGVLPLHGVAADVSVRAVDGAFAVSVAGGEPVVCPAQNAAATALGLARAFLERAAAPPSPALSPRKRGERGSRASFDQEVPLPPFPRGPSHLPMTRLHRRRPVSTAPPKRDWTIGNDGAAARWVPAFAGKVAITESPSNANALRLPARGVDAGSPIGLIPYPTNGHGAFGIGVPFGTMRAPMLATLADLALRFGDGQLRLTPWRAVLIGGVAERSAGELAALAESAGLIADPADPRLRVIACAGRPGCCNASVEARNDAALVAPLLRGFSGTVHVSGCRKGCAHRQAAEFTLIGDNARYGLVRNGAASAPPEIAGLGIGEACELIRRELAA